MTCFHAFLRFGYCSPDVLAKMTLFHDETERKFCRTALPRPRQVARPVSEQTTSLPLPGLPWNGEMCERPLGRSATLGATQFSHSKALVATLNLELVTAGSETRMVTPPTFNSATIPLGIRPCLTTSPISCCLST